MYVSAHSEQDFIYVMFDLSSIPTTANIISAQLKMYLSSTGGDIYGSPADKIGAYYCSDNLWTEQGITWNNKPSFNTEPTGIWSFSMFYTYNIYKSWDVTADVETAVPSGTLTETLKFESKTSDGYAIFQSKEASNEPKLEIEYSMEPVFTVNLESIQDGGGNDNLGRVTFADSTFSLPTDIEVVAGNYQVSFSGGYTFMRWETTGGVSVSDTYAVTTSVTVSGAGTLRAVGNVNQLEYAYDYDNSRWGDSRPTGDIDAVRFTPLFTDQLLIACYYMDYVSSSQSNTFKVHIMDENRGDLVTPFEQTPTTEGWFNVDLSSYGINVNEGVDFYIGIEWITDYNPDLGEDTTDPSDRSWYWNGTDWREETSSDFMIRAVVGTEPDGTNINHVISDGGTDFQVTTESTSEMSNCQLVIENKKLLFDVAETSGCYGFCTVTIPNELLGGPYEIESDGQPLSGVVLSENDTHSSLAFTYSQCTTSIEIIGSTVIPELSSATILLIFTFAALIAVALTKIRCRKTARTK